MFNVNLENVVTAEQLVSVVDNKIVLNHNLVFDLLMNRCLNVDKLFSTIQYHIENDLFYETEELRKESLLTVLVQTNEFLEITYEVIEEVTGDKVLFINNSTQEFTIFASANHEAIEIIAEKMISLYAEGLSKQLVDSILCCMDLYKAA